MIRIFDSDPEKCGVRDSVVDRLRAGMQATVVAGEPVGGANSVTIEVIYPLIDLVAEAFGYWAMHWHLLLCRSADDRKFDHAAQSGRDASRTIAPRYNGNHRIIGLKSAVILGGRNR
jgi:hypothetical protein